MLRSPSDRSPARPRASTTSEREDEVDVVGLAAEPLGQPGERVPPAGAEEVVLDVGPVQAGVTGHGRSSDLTSPNLPRFGWTRTVDVDRGERDQILPMTAAFVSLTFLATDEARVSAWL
jgi:hypothetical protein